MIEVAIMLEGQNGLTWERFKNIAIATEELGFVGLYRSDHYTNANPPDKESLELWVSLAWLATHTEILEFGPLVSPLSFREPTMTARMARDVDDLSAGRLHLGLGAGWQEREHNNFGHDLLDIPNRFARFAEGLEVISQLLHSDEPVDFTGDYYQLADAVLLPRPHRVGGPPILIGGNGEMRTLPLVAKYAQEWNSIFLTPERFREKNQQLDKLLITEGRQASEVRRSMMLGLEYGRDDAEVRERVKTRTEGKLTPKDLTERGLAVGTGDQIVDHLGKLEEVGVQRVMLQWLDLDDMDRFEALAKDVMPHVQA